MTGTMDESLKKFSIQVDLYGGKNFTLCAPDETSMEVWIDAWKHRIEDKVKLAGADGTLVGRSVVDRCIWKRASHILSLPLESRAAIRRIAASAANSARSV